MAADILDQMVAQGRIPADEARQYDFFGESNAQGIFFPKSGLLPRVILARKQGKKGIFVHPDQVEEAAIVSEIDVLPVGNMATIEAYFKDPSSIQPVIRDTREIFAAEQESTPNDMAEIIEDENAKHALEIAAIGRHHLLLYGDPRSGKNRLVEHLPGTLPRLNLHEALELTRRFSVEGKMKNGMGLLAHRPLLKIGPYSSLEEANRQIFLSHLGILWLQDLSEIDPQILERVGQVIEERGLIWNGRRQPCHPMVVATSSEAGISAHLEEHIDIFLEIPIIAAEDHLRFGELETSLEIRERVEAAAEIQAERYVDEKELATNADLPLAEIKQWVQLDKQAQMLLNISLKKQGIDSKRIPQILRVARSIADRVGENQPLLYHVAEAVQYQPRG